MNADKNEKVKKIVQGCIRGERKSQHQLYKTYYGKMMGVCMRYAANEAQAEDFLHEGFLKVFDKLSSYNHKGSFEGWIRRIIVNNCIDKLRKKKEVFFQNNEEKQLEGVLDEYEEEEYIKQLQKAKAKEVLKLVQKLSPAYKTVFNLYVIEDYTHQQIADELSISVGASKSNLAKAKAKIREMYKELYKHD